MEKIQTITVEKKHEKKKIDVKMTKIFVYMKMNMKNKITVMKQEIK